MSANPAPIDAKWLSRPRPSGTSISLAARRCQGRWLAGLLLGGLISLVTVPATQAQNLPAKKFMNDNTILLPVYIEARFLDELKEVQLYYKENPGGNWKLWGSCPPSHKEFLYKAPADGEYWFTLVTVNKLGQPSVASVVSQSPQAIVVLDREAPKVQVKCLGSIPAGQCVHCQVSDQNADPTATRFEYQTRDQVWRSLEPISGSFDTYCIPAQAAITGELRITAQDRCGNKAVKVFNLQDCTGGPVPVPESHAITPPKGATPAAPPSLPGSLPDLTPPGQLPLPPQHPDFAKPGALVPVPPSQLPKNPAEQNGKSTHQQTSHSAPGSTVAREFLNKCKLTLNYQIDEVGGSGVGRVEVWITKDLGQHWLKLAEDSDRKAPVDLMLPGEGLFGLTLVASNGLGFGGDPPPPASTPDWWVEVDTTVPQAQLLSVDPLKSGQVGNILITWQAHDKNFTDNPIDLYYAVEQTGPWLPIEKGLKNTGQFRWQVPQLSNTRVYVRLIATDRAGNLSFSQTPNAVQLDDGTRPKIRIQGVNGQTAPASGPALLPVLGN